MQVKMFILIQDTSSIILNFLFSYPRFLTLPKDFWSIIALEWLILQMLLIYTYIRFIGYRNYFKQILALLLLLCVLGIYIAFLQLELFACFMFVAEFTIIIFFYTLFLHLQIATTNQSIYIKSHSTKTVPTVLIFLIIAAVMGWAQFADKNSFVVFSELYRRVSYTAFSDLAFFASTILRTNFVIHILVGLLLFFLTLFLFFVTNIYYFLNITRRDAARHNITKLATKRGYYEQTAAEVQKIISNNKL